MINTKRINLTLPIGIYQRVAEMAEKDGRSLPQMCLKLIEKGLESLEKDNNT